MRLIATAEQSLLELAGQSGKMPAKTGRPASTIAMGESTIIGASGGKTCRCWREIVPGRSGHLRRGRQLGGFSAEALDRLDGYSWPGNLDRVARAVTKSRGPAGRAAA